MNRLSLILCCILVMSACNMKDSNLEIEWNVAGTLPADTDNAAHIGVAGPVTGMIDDILIVAGGANFPDGMPWDGGTKAYSKEVYLYAIGQNSELELTHTHTFEDSVAYAANISLDNAIYSIGGERNGIATSDVYRYYLEDNTLKRVQLAALPQPLTNGGAAHVDEYIYFVGGENAESVSSKVYRLRFAEEGATWEEFSDLPKPITHAVITSDESENIYIIGGRKRNTNAKSDMYFEVYGLNILSKKTELIDNLPETLAAGTGGYFNHNLIVIGGDNAQTFHQVEALIGAINLESDENMKAELIAKKNEMQRSHPGFSTDVWIYNLTEKSWKKTNKLNGASPVTTTAVFYNDLIVIPSGEVRAGVRTDQILMGKIK